MDARHLRYAVALADHQHFGRAAASVGIAQPPLSKQIADLERELGTKLFDRTASGVFPTAAGEVFLRRARRALREMSAAVIDTGRAARGETGQLRLGFVGSALLELLPKALRRFAASHPDVRLQLEEMSSVRSGRALVHGEVDVAVGRGAPRGTGAEGLVSVPVGRDHLVAVVGVHHPYAGQQRVGVAQLQAQPLIVSPTDDEPATVARVSAVLGEGAGLAERAVEARDVHTIIGLAACGVGIGLVPSSVRAVARLDVRICDVHPRTELPELMLSFRARDRSPVLRAFLVAMAEVCPGAADALAPHTDPQPTTRPRKVDTPGR
jgi:DNA-binding transcriptional LysR family regulator